MVLICLSTFVFSQKPKLGGVEFTFGIQGLEDFRVNPSNASLGFRWLCAPNVAL